MRGSIHSRKRLIIFTLVAILNLYFVISLILAALDFSAKFINLEMQPLYEKPESILVTDLNRDGNEELLIKSRTEVSYTGKRSFICISPFEPSGDISFDYFFEELIANYSVPIPPYDIDLDGQIDVPVIEFKDDELVVQVYDINGNQIEEYSIQGFKSGLYKRPGIKDVEVIDINGDQIKELIILLNVGWDKHLGE